MHTCVYKYHTYNIATILHISMKYNINITDIPQLSYILVLYIICYISLYNIYCYEYRERSYYNSYNGIHISLSPSFYII